MPLERDEVLSELKKKKDVIENFENIRRNKIRVYKENIKQLNKKETTLDQLSGFCGAKPLEDGDFVKEFDAPNLDEWITNSLKEKITGAVDGSQIAPRKSYDIPVGLANSILVVNDYSKKERWSDKKISIITPKDFELKGNYSFSKDIVNAERDKLEREKAIDFVEEEAENAFLFVDGPLVLSHVNKMKEELRDKYIEKLRELLRKSREKNVPIIGFVETSYSCDLVYMLDEAGVCEKEDEVYDAIIVDELLEEGDRTKLFSCHRDDKSSKNQPPVLARYGEFQDRITFFYMNLGGDTSCRIEIPRWCYKEELVDEIADLIRSEAYKGNGYPMILNKAHKEAVVNYSERDKFQKLIKDISMGNLSLKDIRKKRGNKNVHW